MRACLVRWEIFDAEPFGMSAIPSTHIIDLATLDYFPTCRYLAIAASDVISGALQKILVG
jgi:hypothetical protein